MLAFAAADKGALADRALERGRRTGQHAVVGTVHEVGVSNYLNIFMPNYLAIGEKLQVY